MVIFHSYVSSPEGNSTKTISTWQDWPTGSPWFHRLPAAAGSDSLPTRLHLDWNAAGLRFARSRFGKRGSHGKPPPKGRGWAAGWWWIRHLMEVKSPQMGIIQWICCLIDKSKVRLHMLMVMLVSCWWLWYLSNTISTPHHSICARVKIWYVISGHPCF